MGLVQNKVIKYDYDNYMLINYLLYGIFMPLSNGVVGFLRCDVIGYEDSMVFVFLIVFGMIWTWIC